MKTLLVLPFFLACPLFISAQNQFGGTTMNTDLGILLGSRDTTFRCTLMPLELFETHEEHHDEELCHDVIPNCLADQVITLDVPRYDDIRVVVPITMLLEKIFHEDYGNRITYSPQRSHTQKHSFAPGHFIELNGDTVTEKITLSADLIREISYRWVVHRELCTLVIAKTVSIEELADELYEVLPYKWKLSIVGDYRTHDVPRISDGQPLGKSSYDVLSIVDGRGVHIRIE